MWSIVRALLFMLRKGILSKRKLIVDLNTVLKRGKTASAKAIGNLMFHHHRHQVSSSSFTAVSKEAIQEYEFSCSNTPNHIFPFNLKKKNNSINNYYHQFFACVHAPPTQDDNLATMNAVKVVWICSITTTATTTLLHLCYRGSDGLHWPDN
ncbi:Casein kinase I protein isoform 1 [Hibiscus syriacus]|uniref:Casein kinase I protein isoform 1 n=1 Tax=Hibiscus syriacus TaxID=106335 RepID=A0A6A3AQS3_HIBSY|nr:Casein kinase I protein isoform 1 [Hibiscus syriacus]